MADNNQSSNINAHKHLSHEKAMIAELEKERENMLYTHLNKEDEEQVEAKL
jgi:hypothetical protein